MRIDRAGGDAITEVNLIVNTFSKLTINCFLTAVAGIFNPLASRADDRAVSGTVTGKVQHVGYRAFILKQAAIEFNLAGWAKYQDDGQRTR